MLNRSFILLKEQVIIYCFVHSFVRMVLINSHKSAALHSARLMFFMERVRNDNISMKQNMWFIVQGVSETRC